MLTKCCVDCDLVLPLSAYHESRRSSCTVYYRKECIDCFNKHRTAVRLANKEGRTPPSRARNAKFKGSEFNQCRDCDEVKLRVHFSASDRNICKACRTANAVKYRAENVDKIRGQQREQQRRASVARLVQKTNRNRKGKPCKEMKLPPAEKKLAKLKYPGFKLCVNCNQFKLLSNFTTSKTWLHTYCRPCACIMSNKTRANRKQKIDDHRRLISSKSQAKLCKELVDSYLRALLKYEGYSAEDITPEMIAFKRSSVRLKRKIKEMK